MTTAVLGVVAATMIVATPARAGVNVTLNPSFELVGSGYASFTGNGNAGPSSATNWGMWLNGGPHITTDPLPSTAPGGGARMLHVTTDSGNSGVVQAGLAIAPAHTATFNLWVYVVQGQVQVGVGANGAPGIGAVSSTHGVWQHLTGVSTSLPVYQIIIYSRILPGDPPYADFYVDLVDIEQV